MGDEESGGNSVATSSATPLINWWDVHATSSLSSWNTTLHSNSSSCCEDHHLSAHAPSSDNNHLWTHVLLGVGSNEEVQNSGETNLMEEVSCKSIMYEPACNYLKQLDTTWDYNHHNNHSSSSSINSTNTTTFDHKHLHNNNNNGFNDESAVLESDERLSRLVTTWSIAPPHQTNHNNNNTTHFDPSHNDNTGHVTLSSCMDHSGVFSSYAALDPKVKQEYHHHASFSEGLLGHHQNSSSDNNNNNSSHNQYGMMMPTRNWTDVISFTGRIGRPIIGIHALKPSFRPPSSSLMTTTVSDHSKKQLFHTSSLPNRASKGRGQGSSTTEVKKKRTDDSSSQAILKKPKQDTSSTASSTKVQAPKVKLGDRITTLQQIVSPFGKTDTASVLFEAIGYIKFLQEQVQLLSNSYMKTNSHRETTWGSMERKEEKGDLKSRGLCLVPISWTPQSYRDNSAPDYWTPAYRGCLFR